MTLEEIITENNLNDFWIEGGTDKASEHSYCPYYEQLLTPYKDKECEILEVGCWQGGFVFAMSQLLPMAKFTTIDIQDKFSTRLFDLIGADRITNHQLVNAYCFKTLKLIEDKQFDIIIDDGTHLVHDEIFLLNNISGYLDLNTSVRSSSDILQLGSISCSWRNCYSKQQVFRSIFIYIYSKLYSVFK